MGQLLLAALCAFVPVSFAVAKESTSLEFGMEMSNEAYKAVCWFENLKVFPYTHSEGYGKCSNGADHIIKAVVEPNSVNKKYFDFYPDKKKTWFGGKLSILMNNLPPTYLSCKKDLKNPKATPLVNESDALNDRGKCYPYKAFAYCLMYTLRNRHGDSAIEAVKNERTHSKKHWMQTLLDRENEFRARHNVQPLELVENVKNMSALPLFEIFNRLSGNLFIFAFLHLTDAAQEWADANAKECEMYHSTGDSRKWNGEATGENLFAGDGGDEGSIAAYQAADGWYEEIKDYPFPEDYTDSSEDDLFREIGHFAQSIWKTTKYVGYGYSYNPKCGRGKSSRYIAARYYPAGNVQGEYKSNVNPPNDM